MQCLVFFKIINLHHLFVTFFSLNTLSVCIFFLSVFSPYLAALWRTRNVQVGVSPNLLRLSGSDRKLLCISAPPMCCRVQVGRDRLCQTQTGQIVHDQHHQIERQVYILVKQFFSSIFPESNLLYVDILSPYFVLFSMIIFSPRLVSISSTFYEQKSIMRSFSVLKVCVSIFWQKDMCKKGVKCW